MKERLRQNLLQRCRVAPGATLLVGLSGGSDSVALLHLLLDLADVFPLVLRAAHLDHAIRPESAAEADFVADLCRSLRVPLATRRIDVPRLVARLGGNLEAVAREQRRAWLLETAAAQGHALVALAHQRDDQAETVLQRLLRGTGSRGLGGMAWRSGPVIRPLLDVTRDELRGYLATRQIAWCEDPSNGDPALTRSRIRHGLLPELQGFNPRIGERLSELAEQLRDEEAFWETVVEHEFARLADCRDGEVGFTVEALRGLQTALRRRLLRRSLAAVREGALLGLEAKHLRAVESLLEGARPQAAIDLPGCWVGRRYDRLLLRRTAPAIVDQPDLLIDQPGSYLLADGSRLVVELGAAAGRESANCVEFSVAQVALPLILRRVRPGDCFVPSGMAGHKKLKDYFIDARIDRETRQRTAVVAEPGGEILWLAGLRRSEGRRPAGAGEPVVRLTMEAPENQTFDL